MKITKFVHSCLLVETPDQIALFDPGTMSEQAFNVGIINRLDDIFITHIHPDHFSSYLVKRLVDKFPQVRITSTPEVVAKLAEDGIKASDQPPSSAVFFDSPHESIASLGSQTPQQIGIHYLDMLSHPGDSHSFHETKPILALPVQAPWGSTARAVALALELKPFYVLPIHDWHWSDTAREQMYNQLQQVFAQQGATFYKLQTGEPVEIDL